MISPICSRCAASAGRAGASAPASWSAPPTSMLELSRARRQARGRPRCISIRAPTRLAANAATYHFELAPQQIDLAVRRGVLQQAARCTSRRRSFAACWRTAARCGARRRARPASRPRTTSSTRCCARSMADLNMLMTETPQGRYPYAGIPWYSTTFGRDGLITALQMLWIDPRIARGVLRRLAAYQAKADRSARRCRARQDPARDARRRDGGAARGAVRALLRQRRFDAAVRAAGRPLCRAHRRRRNAGASCGPRSKRRCAGSTARAIRTATASSNISAPPSRGSPIRAGRIPTTRSFMPTASSPKARSRWPRCRATSLPPSSWRRAAPRALGLMPSARRSSTTEAQRARRALRRGVLVRGTRHLCARARRRQAAVQGAHVQCRPAAVHRHRARRTARAHGRGRSDAAALLLRLGHPHRGARRGALQSDVLSQRLDLAARQCADRARAWRATA